MASTLISNNLIYQRIVAKSEKEKSHSINKLFHLKNSHFSQKVSLDVYPFPNKIRGFASYLFTYAEIYKIACLILVSSQEEYQININSVRIFSSFADGISIFKDKLSETFLKTNHINLGISVFSELDTNNKMIYT